MQGPQQYPVLTGAVLKRLASARVLWAEVGVGGIATDNTGHGRRPSHNQVLLPRAEDGRPSRLDQSDFSRWRVIDEMTDDSRDEESGVKKVRQGDSGVCRARRNEPRASKSARTTLYAQFVPLSD